MLHHDPVVPGGGCMLHPPVFMHRERMFRDYDRAPRMGKKGAMGWLLRS
jgi:hypothetical protein